MINGTVARYPFSVETFVVWLAICGRVPRALFPWYSLHVHYS